MTTRYVFVDPTDYKTDVNVAEELMKKLSTSSSGVKPSDAVTKSNKTQVKKREEPPANPCNFTDEFKAMIPMINCGIVTGAIHGIVGKRGPPGTNVAGISPYKYYNDATATNNSIMPTITDGNTTNDNAHTTIGNGSGNIIQPGASISTIVNGTTCEIYGTYCMVYGGTNNKIVLQSTTMPSYTSILSGSNITTNLSNTAVAQNLQNTGGRIEGVTNAIYTGADFFQLTADHHHVFNGDSNIISFRLPVKGDPTISIGQIYELRSLVVTDDPMPVAMFVLMTLPLDVKLSSIDSLSISTGILGDLTVPYNFTNLRIILQNRDASYDYWVIINQI
jgi:hypothetical protein